MPLNNRIFSLLAEHEKWRTRECINLIPSENVASPAVCELLASDLGNRYTLSVNSTIHGVFIRNAYGGTKYTNLIESEAEEIAKQVFNAKYCTLKPLSGHIAGMIMVLANCAPGHLILAIDANQGGYDGYLPDYIPKIACLSSEFLPFDEKNWNLDFEACAQAIHQKKPRLVVIGASFILFPYDIKPLREACDEVGSLLAYDASHVLGLIAGGEFQEPLKDGVDIVTGSTHKTLFGPQGGLIVTNREDIFENVSNKLAWHTIDNAHQHRIAALGQSLYEAQEFGSDYAKQIVKNSKHLAHVLDESGIPVKFGHLDYTESHQVLLDLDKIKSEYSLNSMELMGLLEDQNIIVDAVGRFGTNEMTRRGCFESEIEEIANFIHRVVVEKDKTVKNEVIEFLKNQELAYCF
jgi:glycine hydroxymethyltransferase